MIASDQTAFLAFLAENPTDLVARAVYADWLEENGQADKGATQRKIIRRIENAPLVLFRVSWVYGQTFRFFYSQYENVWWKESDDVIEKSPYTLAVINVFGYFVVKNVSNFYDKKVGERL